MRARVIAGHLGLALVVTLPLAVDPFGRLVGSPAVDIWNHAWGPWWWASALAQLELPWRTELLLWPDGGTLWFIDPVLAALGAPLVGLVGLAGATNLALLAMLVFASWAGRRFALALGATPTASWVCSAGLVGSAWVVCELHNGITEAVDIGPAALALAWGAQAMRDPGWGRWALAGLGVGLAALASPYLGLGAGLAMLVCGLRRIGRAWLGAAVAVVVAAPPTLLLRAQLQAADAIVKHPEGMNEQLALHNAVDPRTFVLPLGFRSVDLSAEGFQHSMYLGLVLLALAAVGVVRARRTAVPWVVAAAVCALVALGPWLYWGDGWVTTATGARLRLPWWWIQQAAPGLAVTHPLRLAVPALVIVSGLAAVGASVLGPRAWAAALVVLVDGLVLSGAPWPLATADPTPPPVFADLAAEPGEPVRWGILDLPTDAGRTMATSRYLAWQAGHGRPIPYAPDARASTSALINEPPFRVFAGLSDRRPDEHGRLGFARPGPGSTDPARLARHGIRWIVLHRWLDPDAAAAIEAHLVEHLGPGREVVGPDGVDLVWDLGPDAAPTAPRHGRDGRG